MTKILTDKLLITSDFYSIQGEGISSGIPSYFIRLGICNLSCGVSRSEMNNIIKEERYEDGEIFTGDLHEQGKATWTCDSISQWAYRGENRDFSYLVDRWEEQDVLNDIKDGLIHIIWTGGEPTIPKHQESILNFSHYAVKNNIFPGYIVKKCRWEDGKLIEKEYVALSDVFYEIETNGTYVIKPELLDILGQINCSPKLENSGMSKRARINEEAIESVMSHNNYQFKFVISNEEDVEEMFRDFIIPFNIPLKNVVCMPGLDEQVDFHERTQFALEMAKKYRFRGLTRLHISAWDKTLNV